MGRPVSDVAPSPIHRRKRRRRNELAGDPVEHIKEASLVRLHQNLARAPVHLDIGKEQLLDAIEVPRIAGHRLVMPHEISVIRIHSQDGTYIKVVHASGIAAALQAMAHRYRCRRKSG